MFAAIIALVPYGAPHLDRASQHIERLMNTAGLDKHVDTEKLSSTATMIVFSLPIYAIAYIAYITNSIPFSVVVLFSMAHTGIVAIVYAMTSRHMFNFLMKRDLKFSAAERLIVLGTLGILFSIAYMGLVSAWLDKKQMPAEHEITTDSRKFTGRIVKSIDRGMLINEGGSELRFLGSEIIKEIRIVKEGDL